MLYLVYYQQKGVLFIHLKDKQAGHCHLESTAARDSTNARMFFLFVCFRPLHTHTNGQLFQLGFFFWWGGQSELSILIKYQSS